MFRSFLKTKPKHFLNHIRHSGFTARLVGLLLAFLILVPTILLILKPDEVSAAWYDDNYAIRQKISFTHNADITTPRRISFTLNTQILVSNGVMQTDCDDTRFTDLNGKLLRFKLTGNCNAGSTTYEVVFPSILNGTNVGYVYYGNLRAVNASQDVGDVSALTPSGGNPSILTRLSEEQSPSPVVYLMLDEGYGSTTRDATPNSNNGGIRGASWRTKELCLSANCLQFDGVDDSVIATNAASIDFDTGLATGSAFQAWVRVNSTGENNVGQILNKGTNTYLRVTNSSNGRVDLEAKLDLGTTDATVTVTQGIELNKWTHVAMGYTDDNDDEITVYINGISKGSSINGDGPPASADTNDLLIGGPNAAHFKGFIDEVKVYPYERTTASVTTDISAISSLHGKSAAVGTDDSFLSDGLVGYWKMDDGVGNACPAGVDKACDSSGNGNTGTWTGGTASTSGKFGYATNYDGVNDYVSIPNSTNISAFSAATWSWWGRHTTVSGDNIGIIEKTNSADTTDGYFIFRDSNGGIRLTLRNNDIDGNWDSPNGIIISDNTWHHYTVTWNGSVSGGVKMYKDGSQLSVTEVDSGALITAPATLCPFESTPWLAEAD